MEEPVAPNESPESGTRFTFVQEEIYDPITSDTVSISCDASTEEMASLKCELDTGSSVGHAAGRDEAVIVKMTSLQTLYRPVLVALHITGLAFWLPSCCRKGAPQPGSNRWGSIWWNGRGSACAYLSLLYHGLVLATLWVNPVLYFFIYHKTDTMGPHLVMKLLAHFSLIQAALSATACTRFIRRMDLLFSSYADYVYGHGIPCGMYQNTRRFILIALIIMMPLIIFFVAFNVYIYITNEKRMTLPVSQVVNADLQDKQDNELSTLGVFFYTILLYLATWAWGLCLIMFVSLCLNLRSLFCQFNKDFMKDVETRTVYQGDLEQHRQRHGQLCDLVNQCDHAFSVYTMKVYITNIIIICLFLYLALISSLTSGQPTKTTFINTNQIPVVCACLLELLVVTAMGTEVSKVAMRSKKILLSMVLDENFCTRERSLQYQSFLSRLTEGHIGFTGWKLFYINKQTFKMVIFMIIGYSVVLLKFGNVEVS